MRAKPAVLEHDDPAGLLDDVEPAGLTGRRRRIDRCVDLRHLHEVERRGVPGGCTRQRQRPQGKQQPPHRRKMSSTPDVACSFALPSAIAIRPPATIGLCQWVSPIGSDATGLPVAAP